MTKQLPQPTLRGSFLTLGRIQAALRFRLACMALPATHHRRRRFVSGVVKEKVASEGLGHLRLWGYNSFELFEENCISFGA